MDGGRTDGECADTSVAVGGARTETLPERLGETRARFPPPPIKDVVCQGRGLLGSAHRSRRSRLKSLQPPSSSFYHAARGAGGEAGGSCETHICMSFYRAGCVLLHARRLVFFPRACRRGRWPSDTLGLKPRCRRGAVSPLLGAARGGSGTELISIQHA